MENARNGRLCKYKTFARSREREKETKMNITIIKLLRSFGTGPKRLVKRSTKYNVYQKRLRASVWPAPCV